MNRQLFVSLDGPKGAGKTTLLEAITARLRADNRKVIRLCEKKSDPDRAQTMALVNRLARDPSLDLEREVCERLAASRAWISRNVLTRQPPDSIILMDRWYPSDAAFRRRIPFAEILQMNHAQDVRIPDLHVGVVTAPEISWSRAAARSWGWEARSFTGWKSMPNARGRSSVKLPAPAGFYAVMKARWMKPPCRSRLR